MDCVAQYFIIDINFSECCHGDTGDNYFTTDFFLSTLLLLLLPQPSFFPASLQALPFLLSISSA